MSLQPPVLESRPVPLRHPLKADAKTISFAGNAPRFGGKDIFFGGDALPEWTKGIADPKFTKQNIDAFKKKRQEERNKLSEAQRKPKENQSPDEQQGQSNKQKLNWNNVFNNLGYVYRILKLKGKIDHELNYTSQKYLPEVNRKQLFWYKFNPRSWYYRLNRFAGPDLHRLRMQGPDALKGAQNKAQHDDSVEKPHLEIYLQGCSELLKDKKAFDVEMKGFQRHLIKLLGPMALRLAMAGLKWKIKSIEKNTRVLNKVPPFPKKDFKKQLDELQKNYNSAFPNDPIVEIGKAIKAGSIGQVFDAKTKSGKKLVLKVVKPEITPKYLDDYRKFLYFRFLVQNGVSAETKKLAVNEISNKTALLKEEADARQELANTKAMKKAVQELGVQGFDVPQILASSDHGFVLPFVGEKDFQEINDSETRTKHINKIVPDLMRFLTISNAKPLDIHSGNVRIGGDSAYFIDHGRQANLNEKIHQSFLSLMTAVYSSDKTSKYFHGNIAESKEVRDSLKHLYSLNHNVNNEYTKALTALDALDIPNQKYDNYEKLKPEMEKINKLVKLLFDGNMLFKKDDTNSTDWRSSHSELSILSPWANYMNQSKNVGLPSLSEKDLSTEDLKRYKDRSSEFMKSYFSLNKDSKNIKRLTDDLKNEKVNQLVTDSDILYHSTHYNSGDTEEQKAQKLVEAHTKIKKYINETLNGENKNKKERLLKVYDIRQKLSGLSKAAAISLSQSPDMQLSDNQKQVLEKNISSAIKNDFDIYNDLGSLLKHGSFPAHDEAKQEIKVSQESEPEQK